MLAHTAAIAVVVLLVGCHAGSPKPPLFKLSPTLDVYDDFEEQKLSRAWSHDRFEEGAVVMESSVVRAGKQAVSVTVRSRDKFEAGRHGDKDSERAELRESTELTSRENVPYEFSFSEFFPGDFPIVPTRLVIAQWKQYCPEGKPCDDDSPVLALRYIGGELLVTQTVAGQQTVLYRQAGELRNRWLDFRVRARFTPKAEGHIAMWLGGHQIVDVRGATANPENATTGYASPGYFYFKMGLYRDVMPAPMTVYLDEYRKHELRRDEF